MTRKIESIYFDETIFKIPPSAQISAKPTATGTMLEWENTVNTDDPYSFDLEPTKLNVTAKNITESNEPLTLVVSREGVGPETIYTVSLQDNKGTPLEKENIKISLNNLFKTMIKDQQDTYKRLNQTGCLEDGTIDPTNVFLEPSDEENMSAAETNISFFKKHLGHIIKAPDEFYLLFSNLINTADSTNLTRTMTDCDDITTRQIPPPHKPTLN